MPCPVGWVQWTVVGVDWRGEANAILVGASMVKGEITVQYQCKAVGLARSSEASEAMVRNELLSYVGSGAGSRKSCVRGEGLWTWKNVVIVLEIDNANADICR